MRSRRRAATGRSTVKTGNQNAVLQTVHLDGPISRLEIAQRLNLSPAAVTGITAELIEQGLVFEARQAKSSGVGRKAILLEVDYEYALVAGIKVSTASITSALSNLNAEVAYAQSRPLQATEPDRVVAEITRAFQVLQERSQKALGALGISVPGIVDVDQDTVRYSPLLGWESVRLGSILTQRLGVPVIVENDVNALALAEAWYGHGRDHDSFLVVTLGRGVGLGIVLGGELYRGPTGGAGEFGHVLLNKLGSTTSGTERDTVESNLSDAALLAAARERIEGLPQDASPEQLLQLADDGNIDARAILEMAGQTLGRALSILVNIFAPTLIVLGGEGMRASEYLLPSMQAELERFSFGDLAQRVEVVVEHSGDDVWARGAAALAAARFLAQAAAPFGPDFSSDAAIARQGSALEGG